MKRMRTGIDKQKTKKIIIYLVVRRERKEEKTKMIVSDTSITILRHTPPFGREHGCACKETTKGQI